MSDYRYQDYIELRKLFHSYLEEGIEMGQEVKRLYWRDIKRLQRESKSHEGGRCFTPSKMAPLSLDWLMESGYMPEDSLNVEELIEMMDLSGTLHAAIEQLSEQDRQIVVLCFQGCSEREIASTLGGCQKTINKRKHEIFDVLKTKLAGYR